MDFITQAALGAAVGYAVLGRKLGRKAALYGAALGTIPDLDVFVDFGGPVENMTYHRGASHSFLVQLLVAPLFAWLLVRWHRAGFWRAFTAVYLCFVTHSLADTFTVYGTQLLWPISDFPFSYSILFIVDPAYTLPLIAAFIAIMVMRQSRQRAWWANNAVLVLTSLYLLWSGFAKSQVDERVLAALGAQGISPDTYESSPGPLNTLIWRAVAIDGDQYYEVFTSVFDEIQDVTVHGYPRNTALLDTLEDDARVERLRWFTKGQYGAWEREGQVYLADLRMGVHGEYVFNFNVGRRVDGEVELGSFEQYETPPRTDGLGLFFERIWDPSVDLSPAGRSAALR